ncbi:MAG TPA: DUF5985 family protein [Burkholderiales bacterium]|nr:DUF5985 family protein [Burkholderiales bacterium]
MVEFLSGAVTLAHVLAALYFLRFWRKTRDRLFLSFALAFVLFALNQGLAFAFAVYRESTSFIYILRVLGFVLIVIAIVDKNFLSSKAARHPAEGKREA